MILLGKGEEKQGTYKTIINIRCIQAFIGALYLDQGLDIVWKFAEKVIFPHVEQNELLGVVDFKTQFQEYVHQAK